MQSCGSCSGTARLLRWNVTRAPASDAGVVGRQRSSRSRGGVCEGHRWVESFATPRRGSPVHPRFGPALIAPTKSDDSGDADGRFGSCRWQESCKHACRARSLSAHWESSGRSAASTRRDRKGGFPVQWPSALVVGRSLLSVSQRASRARVGSASSSSRSSRTSRDSGMRSSLRPSSS